MKVVLVFGLAVVTLVRAQYEDNYPTHYGHQKLEHEIEEDHKDYHDEPNYKYEYKVDDHHTGDFKGQAETREGDTVKGYYMIKEADGTLREVHYTADSHNGFNAVVKRTGTPTEAPEHEVKKFHPKFYSSHDFDASEHHNQFAYPEQYERRVFKKKINHRQQYD